VPSLVILLERIERGTKTHGYAKEGAQWEVVDALRGVDSTKAGDLHGAERQYRRLVILLGRMERGLKTHGHAVR
jgi:hypothetical protein